MAVPDFRSLMLPLLRLTADGEPHALSEARQALASQFTLSQAEQDDTKLGDRLEGPRDHPDAISKQRAVRGIVDAGRIKIMSSPQTVLCWPEKRNCGISSLWWRG